MKSSTISLTNRMKKLLVTGSSGLIGSEVCTHFATLGWEIHGVDNNQRAVFFGPAGDNRWNQARLQKALKNFSSSRARYPATGKSAGPAEIN